MNTPESRTRTPSAATVAVTGRLAIFDLDRTLYPGSSLKPLAKALCDRGLVGRVDVARSVVGDAAFRRHGAGDASVDRICRRALATMAGADAEELRGVAESVAETVVADARPMLRALVDLHLQAGSFCVLLSASPEELVAAVARRLGMHRAVGTSAEVVDGRYTGRLDAPFCYGAGKVLRLEQALGRVDLGDAWAYADSTSDLPLLDRCGTPVAVAPSRGLRRVARTRGWAIVETGDR